MYYPCPFCSHHTKFKMFQESRGSESVVVTVRGNWPRLAFQKDILAEVDVMWVGWVLRCFSESCKIKAANCSLLCVVPFQTVSHLPPPLKFTWVWFALLNESWILCDFLQNDFAWEVLVTFRDSCIFIISRNVRFSRYWSWNWLINHGTFSFRTEEVPFFCISLSRDHFGENISSDSKLSGSDYVSESPGVWVGGKEVYISVWSVYMYVGIKYDGEKYVSSMYISVSPNHTCWARYLRIRWI